MACIVMMISQLFKMFRMVTVLMLYSCLYSLPVVDLARILGVIPSPSISHQAVFRAYMNELAKRGHELVIITPSPALPKDRPKDNITEIDVSESFKPLTTIPGGLLSKVKRGVILDVTSVNKETYLDLVHSVKDQFENPVVQKLIADKNQHFDLIVLEAIMDYPLAITHFFKAPVIQFSSFYGFPENYETIGAVSRHPKLHPNFFRNKFRDLSLWEQLYEIYIEWNLMNEFKLLSDMEYEIMKQQFGPDMPTIKELKDKVDLLIVNSHPIINKNRPVPPSVVYLGAGHLLPVKELPKDLKEYLDNTKRAVVYVSLGTNVRPSQMDQDFLDSFLDAFEELPYDILWKFDGDSLERLPKNVKMQKWFRQRDLLMHPNIKAFVTQGGLQSTDESIDAAVPLVGIPIIGDQWYNTNRYVELGIGEQLDPMTLKAEHIVEAVKNVVENKSYKRNIERLRDIIRDQPQRPLDRAVWWTEHVLRHGGARHLRAPAANMSWAEYLMLDILIPATLICITVLILACITLYYTVSTALVLWRRNIKVKTS